VGFLVFIVVMTTAIYMTWNERSRSHVLDQLQQLPRSIPFLPHQTPRLGFARFKNRPDESAIEITGLEEEESTGVHQLPVQSHQTVQQVTQ
jgi:hypothetical protein